MPADAQPAPDFRLPSPPAPVSMTLSPALTIKEPFHRRGAFCTPRGAAVPGDS